MEGLLSVVVPIYNVSNYLDACIQSIINQTYINIEIILVNDGSTDNSLNICKKYAILDSRIIVIDKKNGGLSDARNAGIAASSGMYISLIDSDDIINLNMFELMINLINKTGSDVAVCDFVKFQDGDSIKFIDIREQNIVEYSGKMAVYNIFTGFDKNIHFIACNKIYRRELFRDISYPLGKIHEDEFVTYRILYNSNKVVCTNAKLYYYRQREKSIMNTNLSYRNLDSMAAFEEAILFFDKQGEKELYSCAINRALVSAIILYKKCTENNKNNKNNKNNNKIETEIKKTYSDILRKYINDSGLSLAKKLYFKLFNISPRFGLSLYNVRDRFWNS